MPEPDQITFSMAATETPDTFTAFLTVTRPEEIPAALVARFNQFERN
jgi:hypothetical protein